MSAKLNKNLYLVELLFLCGIITLAYFVIGNITIVTKELFLFCLVVNVLLYKKEVKNVVPHSVMLLILVLNLAGIWFQYIIYGIKSSDLAMNYYLLADVLTAFIMIFAIYMSIQFYIKKGVKEMSFGSIEDYDYYVKDFNLLIASYLMIVLVTAFELTIAYNEIRKYLLMYSSNQETMYTQYLQYIVFWIIPGLIAIGLYQLTKDLRKEEQKKIEKKFKEADSI